jgi:hypothetical protein
MAEPTGVWALHVWRSPGGGEHPQWSGPDDPRPCRCGTRHTLADAASEVICLGVAHVEYARPCVLCGLGWRVPAVVRATAPEGLAPAPSCAYCAARLEHYHIQDHTQEDQ